MHEYRRFVQSELDKRGWSPGQLARIAGMHRQTISKIVKDDRDHIGQMPDESTLEGIARGLGIDVGLIRQAAARSLAGYTETALEGPSGSTRNHPGSGPVAGAATAELDRIEHIFDHTWGIATRLADAVATVDPSDALRLAAADAIGVLFIVVQDAILSSSLDRQAQRELLDLLYESRFGIKGKLSPHDAKSRSDALGRWGRGGKVEDGNESA